MLADGRGDGPVTRTPEQRDRSSGTAVLSAGRPWDAQVTSFFLANHRQLCRYLIAQGCAPCDSDDIVQDAFLIVRGRWEIVSGYDRPKAYLYKVALRLWQRQAARHALHRYRGDPEPQLAGLPDPCDTAATVERAFLPCRPGLEA
jgi:DNA-directed RNA polymerase specialized sigma24 family protein